MTTGTPITGTGTSLPPAQGSRCHRWGRRMKIMRGGARGIKKNLSLFLSLLQMGGNDGSQKNFPCLRVGLIPGSWNPSEPLRISRPERVGRGGYWRYGLLGSGEAVVMAEVDTVTTTASILMLAWTTTATTTMPSLPSPVFPSKRMRTASASVQTQTMTPLTLSGGTNRPSPPPHPIHNHIIDGERWTRGLGPWCWRTIRIWIQYCAEA